MSRLFFDFYTFFQIFMLDVERPGRTEPAARLSITVSASDLSLGEGHIDRVDVVTSIHIHPETR